MRLSISFCRPASAAANVGGLPPINPDPAPPTSDAVEVRGVTDFIVVRLLLVAQKVRASNKLRSRIWEYASAIPMAYGSIGNKHFCP